MFTRIPSCRVARRESDARNLRVSGPRSRLAALVVGILSLAAAPAFAVDPFHAPAEPAGSIEVRLYPTEGVAPGSSRLVTFGVPFPRGSVTPAGLASVRVLAGGVEIPAHVDLLAPWRHRADPAIDGASVRVARIQIHRAFAVPHPGHETVVVEWGGALRTLDVPVLIDPRAGWHPVADASFGAADGVSEPDVYAVLPKSHLAKGLFKPTRMDPFSDAVLEPRDPPAAMDAGDPWPGFEEAERAAKNNFYSLINEDDPAVTAANRCPFRTAYEPWLYDRAAAMFVLHFRSGFPKALREAVRNAEFYRKHIAPSGFFDLKPGDPKYAYNECLAYLRWLTGDDLALVQIGQVLGAHAGTAHKWSPTVGFWTERNAGFKLLAHAVAYEVIGGSSHAASVTAILADLKWHQDGAGGALPADRIDGGLYHYGSQHDGDWADGALGASPWMTVLIGDAVLRAYATDGAASTAHFLRRVGHFLAAAVVSAADPMYDGAAGPIDRPVYALLAGGAVGASEYGDEEHALEVAAALAWAHYFAELTGAPHAPLKAKATSLYATYDRGVNHWIRPAGPASGLTAYRVSPWRKYGWEHRTSGSLSWLMKQGAGGAPPANAPPAVAITSPAPGATFAATAAIPFAATATDADGFVAKVEFFVDGVEVAEDTAPPYGGTLAGLPAGAHSLTAVAVDDDGATAVSAPVAFTVTAAPNAPPGVSISAPSPGASFPAGSTIGLAAVAVDADGAVAKVEFFRGTVKIGEDTTAPFTAAWPDAVAGSYVLTARATDDDGATADSAPVDVTVTAPANAPPTVALTAPAPGATYSAPATVTLVAAAADADGSVVKVEFFSGTSLVATAVAPPWSIALSGLPEGGYSFTAKATDDAGATATSAPVGIAVSAGAGGDVATVTAVFRQGRNGYAGGRDVTISTQYLDSTAGEGVTTRDDDLSCFAIAGPGGYEKRALVRFGDLGLPAGAKVKSATLRLRAVTWDKGFSVHGRYLKAAWGADAPHPGWLHRAAGLPWAAPGAGGEGTDRVAGKGFTLSGFKGKGEQTMTVTLDPAMVQTWVDDPAANQGVLLVNGAVGKVLRFRSAEAAVKTHRPTLTLVYESGPGTASAAPPPATVTVSFRTGVAGYAGTRDVSVSTLYADEAWNGGHGATFPTGEMPCYEVTGPGGYEARAWLRFDGVTLPAGAKVKSATLTLAFDTWDAGFTIRGRYLQGGWSPTKITWLLRDLGLPWASPGAGGDGTDVVAGKSFTFSGFSASGLDVLSVALDPSVVQAWVDGAAGNSGLLLVNEDDDKIAKILSSEASTLAHRPLLTIVYEP